MSPTQPCGNHRPSRSWPRSLWRPQSSRHTIPAVSLRISATHRQCGRTSSIEDGRLHRPFIYPLTLVDRLEHKFAEDRSTRVPLDWFSSGTLVTAHESRRSVAAPGRRRARARHLRSRPARSASFARRVGRRGAAGDPPRRDSRGRRRVLRRPGGQPVDADRGFRPRPARHLRGHRPSRDDAAGPQHRNRLLDDDGHPRPGGLAVSRARSASRGGGRAPQGVRRSCTRRWAPGRFGFCCSISCLPLAAFSRCRSHFCFRPSSWPRPRSRSSALVSRNPLQAGELCFTRRGRPALSMTPPGFLLPQGRLS